MLPANALTDLPARDLLAIDLMKAYVAFHGKIQPDAVRDSIVGSANELAKQLEWAKD